MWAASWPGGYFLLWESCQIQPPEMPTSFCSCQQFLLSCDSPELCTWTRQPPLQLVSLSRPFTAAAKSSQQALLSTLCPESLGPIHKCIMYMFYLQSHHKMDFCHFIIITGHISPYGFNPSPSSPPPTVCPLPASLSSTWMLFTFLLLPHTKVKATF